MMMMDDDVQGFVTTKVANYYIAPTTTLLELGGLFDPVVLGITHHLAAH
jgi:hypothetical protein